MQTKLLTQVFSFSLAALITVGMLAGIDYQAQPEASQQHVAQLVMPKA